MGESILPSRQKLYTIVFTSGFTLMTFEMAGARVLAPFLGMSTYVWASIIGVIMGAMSAGYVYGGRLADKNPNTQHLARLILYAAIGILAMNLFKNAFLRWLGEFDLSLIVKSITASAVLFSLPSFFMAAVLPFVLRLALTEVAGAGQLAGKLYAVSTIGCILGTFAGAVVFIPLLGTTALLWVLAAVLFALALLCATRIKRVYSSTLFILLFANVAYSFYPKNYTDRDTAYNRVIVRDGFEPDGRPGRYLFLNGYVNSGMYTESPGELLYYYTRFYGLISHFTPGFKNVLMLGGGGYSFPKYFQDHYPDARLDIVEIDAGLTELAEEQFGFKPSSNTQVAHEDARTFLQREGKVYDAILCDVFTSPQSVPFQMTTLECYQLIHDRLRTGGVYITNVLAHERPGQPGFLQSQLHTMSEVFPQVMAFDVQQTGSGELKNFMLVGLKSPYPFPLASFDPGIDILLAHHVNLPKDTQALLLTDDYAPTDWLLASGK